ncbi:MAG: hypothetical protein EXR86_05985 [Gammaproteobacteria bacterium]|nr:hypothetical protein [Gammaproteobacteria bacterium]
MNKYSLLLTALVMGAVNPGFAADDSLASKFGRNRVKIQRAQTPSNVSDAKLQTVRSVYKKRVEGCRGQADRNKQYCLQEAEQELRMAERKLRDAVRAAAEQ